MNEKDVRRGDDAQRVLAEPILQEAFAEIRNRLVSQLESAEIDQNRRRRINDLLVATAKVKKYLESVVAYGAAAALEIEKQETMLERMKARVIRRAA